MEPNPTWLRAAMRRMGDGERWLTAELAVRGIGLVLLALCAVASVWLYRSLHRPPPHSTALSDFAAATTAVTGWALGWAAVVEGPALFKLMPLPARSWLPARRLT